MANTKPSAAQATNTKRTIEEILDLKKPLETECEILMDSAYQQQIRELESQLVEARRNDRAKDISQPSATKIQQKIDAILEEAQDYIVTFRFRDIGRKKLDKLARDHPPTKEQQDEYKKLNAPGVLEFNVDTFGPALVAAASLEPKISLEHAETIFEDWGAGDIDLLFGTALAACKGRASLPKSRRGTAETSNSD